MSLTKCYVEKAFALLEEGKFSDFLTHYVCEKVQWTITGSNVLSGLYTSRKDFEERAISRLMASLIGNIIMKVSHVYVDDDVAVVEMQSIATAKAGHPYNNEYCWIQRFNKGKIVEVRVYYDDVLVNKSIM